MPAPEQLPPRSAPQALLAKEIASFVQRLRLLTPPRWKAELGHGGTRADVARHLAQALADAAAPSGETRRVLPVLAVDLLVADQLAVTGDDVLRSAPEDDSCGDLVAHLLLHRFDLLGEEPPTSLGGPAALVHGRRVCDQQRPATYER